MDHPNYQKTLKIFLKFHKKKYFENDTIKMKTQSPKNKIKTSIQHVHTLNNIELNMASKTAQLKSMFFSSI
jgi:hypothetical protein